MILAAFVVALSVGRVYAANRLVEASEKLKRLDNKIQVLEQENQTLAQTARAQKSTEVISRKAQALGFLGNVHYSFLTPAPQMASELPGARQTTP